MHSWSLITVSHNSESALQEYWSNVRITDLVEWVVVDNASQDRSADVAESLGARVIRSEENLGFGAANNLGFNSTASDFVAFVNPDVTPNLSDLPILESVIQSRPGVLAAPQLVFPDGAPQPNGRGAPTLINKIRNRIAPASVRDKYTLFAQAGQNLIVTWLTGAVIAGAREHLQQLGPWDERFFVYYEDIDLCLRNSTQGGTSIVVGDVSWVHGWARATASLNFRSWKMEIDSLTKFYSRYPGLLLRSAT